MTDLEIDDSGYEAMHDTGKSLPIPVAANIAWIDVETNGLDAHKNRLLEIAVVITDPELNILHEDGYHAIVHYDEAIWRGMRAHSNAYVQEMHDQTGLWQKLSGPKSKPLSMIDAELFKYLRWYGRKGQMPLGGNSPRLDLNFMEQWLPKSYAHISYQMRDVTTVAKLAQAWYPGLPEFRKLSDHTASLDIRESIRELKHYRREVFRSPDERYTFSRGAEFHKRAFVAERAIDEVLAMLQREPSYNTESNVTEARERLEEAVRLREL